MQPVALEHASRLLNHGPTVLVSSAHEGERNVMAAAWSMPVEFTPPRIAVVIDKRTRTRDLVAASGRLALNIPCAAQADLTWTVGSVSGHDEAVQGSGGKLARYGIACTTGPVLGMPLLDGCLAWLECRVLPEPRTEQAYDTFFVEVAAAWADERVFRAGRWQLDEAPPELRPIHHLGGGTFVVSGQVLTSKLMQPLASARP